MMRSPVFADIVGLLDILVNHDPNIEDAPHGAFWHTARDAFLAIPTDSWGIQGPLVVLGQPENSNLYLALAGKPPFDDSRLPRMPDTDANPAGRYATNDELALVAQWISNGCPA
jgi:hypothetical protein